MDFTGHLDRTAVAPAVALLEPLVVAAGDRWDEGSALPGMSVGALARHLVSQPECAVQFLSTPPPEGAPVVTLRDYADRLDWLDAPVDAPENTSIVADFTEMAAGGSEESLQILRGYGGALDRAMAGAGPVTFVPWQGCSLATDDFLVMRLLEIVVHADDLAASLGVEPPDFPDAVTEPVLALLALLAARRRGAADVVRALSRTERAPASASAF